MNKTINKNPKATNKPAIRCAIYTRKSCEEGLELDSIPCMHNENQPRPSSRANKMKAGPAIQNNTMTADSPVEA